MNKSIFILSMLFICGKINACEFDCSKFNETEVEIFKELKYANDDEQFATLKTLVSTCELEDPVAFARIRALLCVNWNWLNREKTFLSRPFSLNWTQNLTPFRTFSFSKLPNFLFYHGKRCLTGQRIVSAATKEELRALMAIAIKRSAKKIISLIYAQIDWKTLFHITYYSSTLIDNVMAKVRVPDDLDFLTNNFDKIEDPIDMAKFLLSFRSTAENSFSESLINICNRAYTDSQFDEYCQFMTDQVKQYDQQHDIEMFKKNLDKTSKGSYE